MSKYFSALAACAFLFHATSAIADTYPSETVTIVVPASPGGATGVVAQVLAQKLSEEWKTRVIVENKPGANGQIGASHVAKSKPDGHTLLMTAEATFVINPFLYKKLQYDPTKDFQPVSGIVRSSQGIVVSPAFPARTLGELIAFARQNPGKVHYGTPGLGSTGHLNAELFASLAGVKLTGVHYKGASPAINDLMGDHIQMMIVSLGLSVPPSRDGKIKMLAVGAPNRLSLLPDIPTAIESGVPGFVAETWFGLFAPAGTPAAVVDKINATVRTIFSSKEVKANYLDPNFMDPMPGSPQEFSDFIVKDSVKWRKIIEEAKVTID